MTRRTLLMGAAGIRPLMAAPFDPGFRLVDVTAAAGIQFQQNSGAFGAKYLPETLGSGALFWITMATDGWTFC